MPENQRNSSTATHFKCMLIFLVMFVLVNISLYPVFNRHFFKTAPTVLVAESLNSNQTNVDIIRNTVLQLSRRQFNSSRKDLPKATPTVRKDSCDGCFLHNFKYILNNENVCSVSNDSETIDLLIVVTTVHENYRKRQALRRTWLASSKNNTANIRYVFLLGETNNTTRKEEIKREHDVYKDIIKEEFTDTYNNLTLKTTMGLKWAVVHCNRARFIMKTDDDMFVNVNNMLDALGTKTKQTNQSVIYGACWTSIPFRNKQSKWYVPEYLYPHKRYPQFCSGTGYVTSMKTAEKLYEVSQHIPFFYLEDVYIGICLQKIGGKTENVKGFLAKRTKKDCEYRGNGVITIHGYESPEHLESIWQVKC